MYLILYRGTQYHKEKVPEDRRKTLVNAERYTTEELKE